MISVHGVEARFWLSQQQLNYIIKGIVPVNKLDVPLKINPQDSAGTEQWQISKNEFEWNANIRLDWWIYFIVTQHTHFYE